jgi:CRISPR-associated protein Csb2
MASLTIQCRYTAHSYTGVRQDRALRDELDWPPAPARLHQAFIASTVANLPDSLRMAFMHKTLDALRWLETLPPPDVIASRLADDSGHRRALLVAMPHNSPAKGDFARYHPDLAPVLRATPDHDGPLFAAYRWTGDAPQFSRDAELHLPAMREAAAKLRYLGRAEDRVECDVHWHADGIPESVSNSLEIWRPSDRAEDIREDVRLLIARPESTKELMAEFQASAKRIARGAKRPARLFLREQGYAREAAEGLLPVHVGVFQIFRDTGNPDELPVVCDAINAHRWRSPLRALACKIAKEPDRWNNPDLAAELISGHMPGGGRTQQPHLAFVPLPSLSFSGKADGRVRRFALLGFAEAGIASDAASIYCTLIAALDAEEIEPGCRLQLVPDPRRDKVWPFYACASRCWVSVTPLVIDRGYKVPTHAPDGTPLSRNERHLRRLAEWTQLVRSSLRHIRLPSDLVELCQIHLTSSPLLPATERAERYRPKEESVPFVHAWIEFSRPVRGPLLLGDRRYFGLGLFVPIK